MKLEKISTTDDIEHYVEGCLNDFEGGISDKDETKVNLCELVAYVYNRAKNQPQLVKQECYKTHES